MYMRSNVINKNIYICFILGLAILLTIGGFFIIRIIRRQESGSFFQQEFNLNNNDNVKLLNKINDEWKFPEEYVIEYIKLDNMDMNWVYAKNTFSEKIILQLHGGAYQKSLAQNGTNYQRSAVQYAKISGARVLTIDYRVAPENPYPAALEDALSAYQWLLKEGYKAENIIIAGDSAGGGLSLATTLYLRDHNKPIPAALITMSAWTKLDYKRFEVPYVGSSDAKAPYISPYYGDYTGFPPMLMQVGGDEKLLKDTTEVAKKAEDVHVKVIQSTYDKMFHVFQLLYPVLPDANDAWDEVESFINNIFN